MNRLRSHFGYRVARALAGAVVALALGLAGAPVSAQPVPTLDSHEGDLVVHDFKFHSGQVMPELRLHYLTLGHPLRDAAGHVTNAVLLLHGTGGSGSAFLRPQFAGVLFVPGGLLDPARYFIILPDGIGHGKSSKPSDGLRAQFPQYDYDDMVEAQYQLVTRGLGVDHLRLILGTSMGCMHSFLWGESHPEFMDALMPLACLPVQIAGRNRMWRAMAIDAIRDDPGWNGGNYATEPRAALRTAADLLLIAGSAPAQFQVAYPRRDDADQYALSTVEAIMAHTDANDLLYQLGASGDYDPSARLGRITAPVMWVNSADDFINPPELGIAQEKAKELAHGRFVLLPISEMTHGHGTHSWAVAWKPYLEMLLEQSQGHRN